jgi:uracil-DNA glycosylase family 4
VLEREIVRCRACPRLVAWREEVARVKVARFRDCEYWGKPVPGFGDPNARILLVGLAPGAHGANRTGRMFTGDRSGDFLFAALHRAGLASQPSSQSRGDGLSLRDVYIIATIRCAPPANLPSPEEIEQCARFFDREVALLPRVRVLVALGAIAWRACLDHVARMARARSMRQRVARRQRDGVPLRRPRPAFEHGAILRVGGVAGPTIVGSFHVSQQNTQTGRLTPAMFDAIVAAAMRLADEPSTPALTTR